MNPRVQGAIGGNSPTRRRMARTAACWSTVVVCPSPGHEKMGQASPPRGIVPPPPPRQASKNVCSHFGCPDWGGIVLLAGVSWLRAGAPDCSSRQTHAFPGSRRLRRPWPLFIRALWFVSFLLSRPDPDRHHEDASVRPTALDGGSAWLFRLPEVYLAVCPKP